MSPETFLRVLGPTHWNVAYVQPSRRPADGRYGENPNRLYKHHQFQVILKPAPDEVQHLYLQSLEACGIHIEQHDIRFEEDNWESPTLGAWGIGWQVLFDGLEITQFTYFQQAGGQELSPISAELTYGLERLAMVLQKVDNVYDLEWAPGVAYRDVRFRDEVEQSKFAFGEVPGMAAGRVRRVPSRPVRQALRLLEDADRRPGWSFPRSSSASSARTSSTCSTRAAASASPSAPPTSCASASWPWPSPRPTSSPRRPPRLPMDRELLLEIGCEEIPASWLMPLSRQLGERLARRARDVPHQRRRVGRDARDAAAPDGRRVAHLGAPDRPRRAGHRSAGRRGLRPGRPADAGGHRLRQARQRRAVGA